jgi:hypothetical protein
MSGPMVFAAGLVVLVLLPPGHGQQAAPPMFNQWYSEALSGILDLEFADVDRLQQQLARNPNDFPSRLKLMAYHLRADRAGLPEDRAKRLGHVLWLIEHHPNSELLHSYVSRLAPNELSAADYQRVVSLWDAAAARHPSEAAVQWNAASFFEGIDPARHMRYLESTAALDPNHPFALRPLAHLYAVAIAQRSAFASRAQAALEASKNVWVLGNAAYILQNLYNRSLQMGAPMRHAPALAERYFLRAKALDPNLDRNTILPRINLEAMERARVAEQKEWVRRFEQAAGKIRRLGLDAFPELPPAVAEVLRARNCRVPQPFGDGTPRNVVRGEFFAKGEAGWAVLCSVNDVSALLAFRNDRDRNPETLTTSQDSSYLQGLGGDEIGYSRQISAVGRDFILRHYRAYGGPVPPPIDHQGIDDAFLEKASVTWYSHQGKWLRLTGAD